MATKKPFKALSKKELEAQLSHHIHTSVGYYDSELAQEREKVMKYYNGELPAPAHKGNSKYVSLDVYDAVESMKAELLETFSAGNRIVTFDPRRPEAEENCRVRTAYADYVVFGQNDGYRIFSDTIQDGLVARAGVVKVWWDKCSKEVEEEFDGLVQDEVDALELDPQITEGEVEVDETSGLLKGKVKKSIDKSQIKIEVMAPEEFLINAYAKCIQSAHFVAHRSIKTFSELLKMGIDEKILHKLQPDGDTELSTSSELLQRHADTGADRSQWDADMQKQTQKIVVYECYVEADMEGTGYTKLYKCLYAGGKLIDDPEEVSHKPFVAFIPLPVPHKFHGSNYAYKVIPTQNARTTLTRSILDHALITNNPRYMVVKGALSNPREMLENRVGGLVNVNRPDGLIPLPQAALNPFVFQTIQLLDEDKEESTGISKLSQGLNKDAISKQNSEGMVEQLVSMSQKRQKIIARNFANQFVKELYLMVDRLAQANESERKVIKVSGGRYLEVDPQHFDGEVDATVELKLGYGELEREAKKLMGVHATLSQDPTMQPMYQLPNKYKLLTDVFEKSGMIGAINYLTPPDQIEPPQPDPMQEAEMKAKLAAAEAQVTQARVAEKKVDVNLAIEQMKLQIQDMKNRMDASLNKERLALDTFEVHERVAQQKEEMELAKQQSDESTKAIVSPSY